MEGGRRQVRREARTEAILDAAMGILATEGPDALTMPRLAVTADAAVGALYRYFPSKDALVAALQRRALAAFRERLTRAIADESHPVDQIRAVASAWWSFQAAEPASFVLLDAAISSPHRVLDDPLAAEVDAEVRAVLAEVATVVARAEAEGFLAPGDATLRAYALWAAVHGAAHFRKRDPIAAVGSGAIRKEVVSALLAGWGARPRDERRVRFSASW